VPGRDHDKKSAAREFQPLFAGSGTKDKKSGEAVISKQPKPRSFFTSKLYMSESELRDDAHKWETTLSGFDDMMGTTLCDPVVELHHNPRIGGADCPTAVAIPYAMVVSVRAPAVKDLYNRVFLRYKGQLEALVPIIDISLST
jgi:hypothetical protein